MSNNVFQKLETTASGDLKTSEDTPVVQISAEYGLLSNTFTFVDSSSSGTTTVVDDKFTCQTGTAADGISSILSRVLINYRPGQGLLFRCSGIFTTGLVNNNQACGLISAENTFAFGYIGTAFGIIYSSTSFLRSILLDLYVIFISAPIPCRQIQDSVKSI